MVIYVFKSSHCSMILTSLPVSGINAVIISDSAGRRVSLKCAEGKNCVTWKRVGEGNNGNFEKGKYTHQVHLSPSQVVCIGNLDIYNCQN